MEDSAYSPNGSEAIAVVLGEAGPRPADHADASKKNPYASRFADAIARRIAADIAQRYPAEFGETTASTERATESERGLKQLDVNFSRSRLGLGFGISLKAVHFSDQTSGNYTHNLKRNDEELRVEASGYHQRQPYAVMVAVVFLPAAALTDGRDSSSFGRWVQYLRPLAGRKEPGERVDLFESVFVGVYQRMDPMDLWFFDVTVPPPRKGKPAAVLSYSDFIDSVKRTYDRRNRIDFQWADERDVPAASEDISQIHDDGEAQEEEP